jgi:molybdopterin converting factor small subunit
VEIRVSYLGLLRNVVGDGEETVRAGADTTVGQLIDRLAERHGDALRDSLYRRDGRLRTFAQVCVDDRDIDDLDGLDTRLDGGGEVSLVVGVYPAEGG